MWGRCGFQMRQGKNFYQFQKNDFTPLPSCSFPPLPLSSKCLCHNYIHIFPTLKRWLLFYFHGSLPFSIPERIPVVKSLRDLCLLFSFSVACILDLLLKIWIMTHSASSCGFESDRLLWRILWAFTYGGKRQWEQL